MKKKGKEDMEKREKNGNCPNPRLRSKKNRKSPRRLDQKKKRENGYKVKYQDS